MNSFETLWSLQKVFIFACSLSLAILAVDLVLPLGVATGVLHSASVLLGIWMVSTRQVAFVGFLGMAFTVIGLLAWPSSSIDWIVLSNRGLAILTIAACLMVILFVKRNENARRKFNAVATSSDSAVVGKTPDGRISSWNESAERIFGYAAHEALGQPLQTIIPDDRSSEELVFLERVQQGERIEHFETKRRRKDGSLIDVTVSICPIADDSGNIVAVINDISKQKEAEWQLEEGRARETKVLELNARLGRVLENSWNEIYVFDAESYKFIQVNRGALSNLGYTLAEIETRTAYDIKPEFVRKTFAEAVQPLRDGTEKLLIFEARHERKDGSTYPVEVRLQLLADEKPPIFVAVINDITARKAAEAEITELNIYLERRVALRTAELNTEIKGHKKVQEALEAGEARIHAILDTAADGIVTIDKTGIILSFNKAAESIFQLQADRATGQNISIFMPENHSRNHDVYLAEHAKSGQSRIIGAQREFVGRRQDGTMFPLELAVSEIKSHGEPVFTGIVRDISVRKAASEKLVRTLEELKQAQDTLVETEKMASLGSLVAGVAHEINTPVGVSLTASTHLHDRTVEFVQLYADGLMKRQDLERFVSTADESCRILESNLHRASDLINSFKQVAVDQADDSYREFLLKDYLMEVLSSLKPKFNNSGVEVNLEIDPELRVNSNPGAVSQILTNLIVNSLTHGYEHGQMGRIQIQVDTDQDDVVLVYQDDGKGMEPNTVANIFEPFFTTKRGNGGSGLGMHIVYNLATQSLGGSVQCSSTPGNGARFVIQFPREITHH